MSNEDRLESLRARHKSLEDAIDMESHRPFPQFRSCLRLETPETTNQRRNRLYRTLALGFCWTLDKLRAKRPAWQRQPHCRKIGSKVFAPRGVLLCPVGMMRSIAAR